MNDLPLARLTLDPTKKLIATVALFAAAIILVVLAALTHNVIPLFVAWIPLVAVPWVLTRPEETPEAEHVPGPGAAADPGPEAEES